MTVPLNSVEEIFTFLKSTGAWIEQSSDILHCKHLNIYCSNSNGSIAFWKMAFEGGKPIQNQIISYVPACFQFFTVSDDNSILIFKEIVGIKIQ